LIRECLIWNFGKHKLAYAKYTVTNEFLYSRPHSDDDENDIGRYHDTVQIPQEKILQLQAQYLHELFVIPFIDLLRTMI
jgi:hypothetical protein